MYCPKCSEEMIANGVDSRQEWAEEFFVCPSCKKPRTLRSDYTMESGVRKSTSGWEYEDKETPYEFPDEIAIVWQVDDVLSVANDLTRDEAREVLQRVKNNHDADIGICWDILRIHADLVRELRSSAKSMDERNRENENNNRAGPVSSPGV